MTILSDLIESAVRKTPLLYCEGTFFRLKPGLPHRNPSPGFAFYRDQTEFIQAETEPISAFIKHIREPVETLFSSELQKASCVAESLQKRYESLKAKSEGRPAPDAPLSTYQPRDLEKEIEQLARSFPYQTAALYRDKLFRFTQRKSRTPAPQPKAVYGNLEWDLCPVASITDVMQDELRAKDTHQPDNALHRNDHLKDKIAMYEFYLEHIFRKDDEYELKIRETGNKIQIYVDVPEHIIEDVKDGDHDHPWYRMPPTQAWITLEMHDGHVRTVEDRAYVPADYHHPFSEPDENWVCVANFEDRAEALFEQVAKNIKDPDSAETELCGKYIRWVLKQSADAMIYGYTLDCFPWRPFTDSTYAPRYAGLKIDKTACTLTPDNRRQ